MRARGRGWRWWTTALLVTVAGALGSACAAGDKRVARAEARAVEPLQEQAAALFDAAAHGDALRLKTMVDWTRWRTLSGLVSCQTDPEAAEVLSRMEAEPQPSARFVDASVHTVRALLAEISSGPMPPRPQPGVMNATLASLEAGPSVGEPSSLARLRTLAAESLAGARELTYEGTRRVTLVFVGGLLVGLLEAR